MPGLRDAAMDAPLGNPQRVGIQRTVSHHVGSRSKRSMGFFQGGLDALVTGISVLGDTLGQALEEGIHTVAGAAIGDSDEEMEHRPTNKSATPATASAAGVRKPMQKSSSNEEQKTEKAQGEEPKHEVKEKPGAASKGPRAAEPASGHAQRAIPKETQLMASRNVATAMATRAKQLQADLRAARREVAQLQARMYALEDENARLKQELHMDMMGLNNEPNDHEEQLRLQVEHLLEEKSQLAKGKRAAERENEMLHQMLLYYEHLHLVNVGRQEGVGEPSSEADLSVGSGFTVEGYSSGFGSPGPAFSPMDARSAADSHSGTSAIRSSRSLDVGASLSKADSYASVTTETPRCADAAVHVDVNSAASAGPAAGHEEAVPAVAGDAAASCPDPKPSSNEASGDSDDVREKPDDTVASGSLHQ